MSMPDIPDGIAVDPRVDWCPKHMEPFRERWPHGYVPASILVLQLFSMSAKCRAWCEEHPTASMPEAIAAVGPMCCAIEPYALLARVIQTSLVGGDALTLLLAEVKAQVLGYGDVG